MAELAIQICGGCGTEVTGRGSRWKCPQCGRDVRAGRDQLGVPAKTESLRELTKRVKLTVVEEPYSRPRTRGECATGPRPCPFVGCRYHLGVDVTRAGSLKFNFPDLEATELASSCALDAADNGPLTLDEVAGVLNITHERARQIEETALNKLAGLIKAEDFL